MPVFPGVKRLIDHIKEGKQSDIILDISMITLTIVNGLSGCL